MDVVEADVVPMDVVDLGQQFARMPAMA